MTDGHIWYAAYGSNLTRSRFMVYLEGGCVPGSDHYHPPCADPTPPAADHGIALPHALYFARESNRWHGCGVAFLEPLQSDAASAYVRLYRITREQFVHVVEQENGGKNKAHVSWDVLESGQPCRACRGWYGDVVCLGAHDNTPVYTCTAATGPRAPMSRKPHPEYLAHLKTGLRECLGLDDGAIARYIDGAITRST